MDASLPSPSSSHHHQAPQKPSAPRSGLTLVLPSLKHLKAAKDAQKSQRPPALSQPAVFEVEPPEKKAPRPVKLKPLKEVLAKLILQIKKKDDYAFFLQPVDPSQVPGYLDAIKHPMDLGTMTNKVSRGKYRSLEEFANDLKLVTSNARTFNPPGSIYYTEADRIEAWALDHIAKAATTVIQYETDWNIDIERDDDPAVNIDDDDDDNPSTSVPAEGVTTNGRSPSVASQVQQATGRRGPRGPYKKGIPSTSVSESIDSDGRLPGSKDGLGAFPPCSDWAKTVLALKLKGKRYKTKKERLRFEKEGPPYLPDGSLDYTEMEDPFPVLSALVPDLLSRPHLTPVYPPFSIPPIPPQPSYSQTQPNSETSTPQPEFPPSLTQSVPSFPSSISLPLDYDPLTSINLEVPVTTTYSKRRHWNIVRNTVGRKAKDGGDDPEAEELPWQAARELHPVDFGSFAVLAGALVEEMKRRGVTPGALGEGEEGLIMLDALRDSLEREDTTQQLPPEETTSMDILSDLTFNAKCYFTTQRSTEAEDYIQDVVYGGPDGFAYVRSLAEFATPDPTMLSSHRIHPAPELELEITFPQYAQNLVDELTEGRHTLLRETAEQLRIQLHNPGKIETESLVAIQTATSLHRAPEAMAALQALLQLKLQKIDMSVLLNRPEELFLSEEEWAGKRFQEKRKPQNMENTNGNQDVAATKPTDDTMEVDEEAGKSCMDIDTSADAASTGKHQSSPFQMEGPEELAEVLDYVAGLITQINQHVKVGTLLNSSGSGGVAHQDPPAAMSDATSGDGEALKPTLSGQVPEGIIGVNGKGPATGTAAATTVVAAEDPLLRNLRLNLLALAKRAPLDTIACLPLELVPEHIRHYIPTFDSTGTPTATSSVAPPTR